MLLVAISTVALWARWIKKRTIIPVWQAALIVFAASFIPFYFADSFYTAVATAAFLGFGLAGVITTMDIIGARIVDDDARKTGIRREGIYSSAMGFLTGKVS